MEACDVVPGVRCGIPHSAPREKARLGELCELCACWSPVTGCHCRGSAASNGGKLAATAALALHVGRLSSRANARDFPSRGPGEETDLQSCVAEIKRLLCAVVWPTSGDEFGHSRGRDEETDFDGCLAEIVRTIRTVS